MGTWPPRRPPSSSRTAVLPAPGPPVSTICARGCGSWHGQERLIADLDPVIAGSMPHRFRPRSGTGRAGVPEFRCRPAWRSVRRVFLTPHVVSGVARRPIDAPLVGGLRLGDRVHDVQLHRRRAVDDFVVAAVLPLFLGFVRLRIAHEMYGPFGFGSGGGSLTG